MPRFAERLELRTWCGGLAASTAERRTSVEGDLGAAVEATAVWVHIDPETRRPARFPPHFLAAYVESAGGRRPRTRLQHPSEPSPDAARLPWTFSGADIDLAGHVNNAVNWRILEEAFGGPGAWADGAVLEAEYRAGTVAGQATVARAGSLLWVLDCADAVAASLSHLGNDAD